MRGTRVRARRRATPAEAAARRDRARRRRRARAAPASTRRRSRPCARWSRPAPARETAAKVVAELTGAPANALYRARAPPDRSRSSPPPCASPRGSGRARCRGRVSRQRTRNDSAGPTVDGVDAARRRVAPAVAVDVEGVVLGAHRHHVPLDERRRRASWNTGVLPTNARPSIAWNLPIGEKTTTYSRSGARSRGRGSRACPNIPPSIEASISGPWSWYGQAPAESLAGGQLVGPGLAGLDVGVAAGEAGQVGAVGARLVVHAVEVHRVRPVEGRVQVLEVHAQLVADARRISGPGIRSELPEPAGTLAQRLAPVAACSAGRRPSPKTVSAGVVLHPHDRVAPVGDDVPGHRHRGDPVLAGRPRTPTGRRASSPPRCDQQRLSVVSLDGDGTVHERVDQAVVRVRPGRVELHARGLGSGDAAALSSTPEFQNPLPCSVGLSDDRRRRRSGRRRSGRSPGASNEAAIAPRYDVGSVSGSPGPNVAVCAS